VPNLTRLREDKQAIYFITVLAAEATAAALFSASALSFLRATAGTAIARLSHRNSVCLSVCPSVTRVDQAKMVQARIIKSSPSAAPRTL